MITHHPGEELLIAYAAGASDEAVSLIVATHLALCPECRDLVAAAEGAGGALLDDLSPLEISGGALQSVLGRLEDAVAVTAASPPTRNGFKAPEPLRSYLGRDLDGVDWISLSGGISYHPILKSGQSSAQLVRSTPGHGVSMHTHKGEEFSLVLTGGFTDPTGHYLRGDVQTGTPELTHHPITDEGEDCIVLAVNDAPLKFSNPLMTLLSKLHGF